MGGFSLTTQNHVENDSNSSRKKKRKVRRKKSKKTNHSPSDSVAALKHYVPCSRNVADVKMLYTWALLQKKILYFEARVMGIGPRFMSLYIPKLAIERHIYYDEVEGLTVEWLDDTSTLLLSQSMHEPPPNKKSSSVKLRPLDETAMIVSPTHDSRLDRTYLAGDHDDGDGYNIDPPFFPLTLHRLSTIPVAVHTRDGGGGPLDIVARLYVNSYFHEGLDSDGSLYSSIASN
ncbi:hypothetical protein CASFOL_016252 [Castilleja foliolosa]|uniref:Uncharacterized protein n=1 Tax=Castilleja foliolosa TaxID=1961234 RepID=A0ABD3DJJ5_9LAMI